MSQTAKYFLAGIALITALSDSVWAQYSVEHYNGIIGTDTPWTAPWIDPGDVLPGNWTGYPGTNWYWQSDVPTNANTSIVALKEVIRRINTNADDANVGWASDGYTNNPFGAGGGHTVSLTYDLIGDRAVSDINFTTLNAGRYMRINGSGDRIIESANNNNHTYSQGNIPAAYYPYIPMFISNGDIEFEGTGSTMTLRYAANHGVNGSGDGSALRMNTGSRLITTSDMLYYRNEVTGNGGSISFNNAQMNGDSNGNNIGNRPPGSGTNSFIDNHSGSSGGALYATNNSSIVFRNSTLFSGNKTGLIGEYPGRYVDDGTGNNTLMDYTGDINWKVSGSDGGAIAAYSGSTVLFTGGSSYGSDLLPPNPSPTNGWYERDMEFVGRLDNYTHTFVNNIAHGSGGAIYANGANIGRAANNGTYLTNSIFTSNLSYDGYGGAVSVVDNSYFYAGTLVFGEDIINGVPSNVTYGNRAYRGGGAFNAENSILDARGTSGTWTFRKNVAGFHDDEQGDWLGFDSVAGANRDYYAADGGAIRAIGTTANLSSVVFDQNTALNLNARGGAIYAEGSSFSTSTATFTYNTGGAAGGAIYMVGTNFTMSSATFTGNTTSNGNLSGGDRSLIESNSIVGGGSAGGAIWMDSNNLNFSTATFTSNTTAATDRLSGYHGGGAIHSQNKANVNFSGTALFGLDYDNYFNDDWVPAGNTSNGFGGAIDARSNFYRFDGRSIFIDNYAVGLTDVDGTRRSAAGGAIFAHDSLFHFDMPSKFGEGKFGYTAANHSIAITAYGLTLNLNQEANTEMASLGLALNGIYYWKSQWIGDDGTATGLDGQFGLRILPVTSNYGTIDLNSFKTNGMLFPNGSINTIIAVRDWANKDDASLSNDDYGRAQRLKGYTTSSEIYNFVRNGNIASGDGGAIALSSTQMSFIADVEFYGNRASTGRNADLLGKGGAIYAGNGSTMYFGTGDDVNHSINHEHFIGTKVNPTSSVFAYNYAMFGGAIGADDDYYSTILPKSDSPTKLYFNSGLSIGSGGESRVVAFVGNWGDQLGGAIFARTSNVTSNKDNWTTFEFEGETIFKDNFTMTDYARLTTDRGGDIVPPDGGGAIYADKAILNFNAGTQRETRFIDNKSATQAGAILAERQSEISFTGTTRFVGNDGNALDTYIISDGNTRGNGGSIVASYESILNFVASQGIIEFTRNLAAEDTAKVEADGGAIAAGLPRTDNVNTDRFREKIIIPGVLSHEVVDGKYQGRDVQTEHVDNKFVVYYYRDLASGATFNFGEGTPVVFRENKATRDGGAIISDNSTLTFLGAAGGKTNLKDYDGVDFPELGFIENIAGRDGGAINAKNNSLITFKNLATFKGNNAGHDGGALYVDTGAVITFNQAAEFIGNTAADLGGAMYIGGSTVYVEPDPEHPTSPADGRNHSTVNLAPAKNYTIVFDGNKDTNGNKSNAVYMASDGVLNITPADGAYVKFYDQITGVVDSVINIEGKGTVELWGTSRNGLTNTGVSLYEGTTNVNKGRFVLKYEDTNSASYGVNGTDGIGLLNISSNGIVALELNTQLGGELITLDGGVIEVSGNTVPAANANTAAINGDIVLTSNGGTFDIQNKHQLTISQVIGDAVGEVGNLTKTGTGVLVFAIENGYTGKTTVNKGTLKLTDGNGFTLQSSSVLELNDTSVLDLANTNQRIQSLRGVSSSKINFETEGMSALDNVLTIETILGTEFAETRYDGTIGGNGIIRKEGKGRLILGGKNTYTALNEYYSTEIVNGTLAIANAAGLGTGIVGVKDTGTLEFFFDTSASNATFANDVEGYNGTVGNISKSGLGRVLVAGNVNLTDNTNNGGNVYIGAGALAVSSNVGKSFVVDNIIVGNNGTTNSIADDKATLEVVNNATATVKQDVSIRKNGTFTVTISNSLNSLYDGNVQKYKPQLVSENSVLVEKGATLNINIRDVTSLSVPDDVNAPQGRSELVIIHAEDGIYKTDVDDHGNIIVDNDFLGGIFDNVTFGGLSYQLGQFNENSFIVLATNITAHGDNSWVDDNSNNGADYVVNYGLAWYASNGFAHGTFNVTDELGEVRVGELKDVGANSNLWVGKKLTKDGVGTLVLTEKNSYSGGTEIKGGRIVAEYVESIGTGSVLNNGVLEFNIADNGVVSNTISGAGRLVKSGNAVLELIGTHSYTGKTEVNAGELQLNGNIAGSAVEVRGNGTIFSTKDSLTLFEASGNSSAAKIGSIDLKSDGAGKYVFLAPGGEEFGKLEVTGEVKFGTGSVYDVQVSSDMNFDKVEITGVAGRADLSGGTISVSVTGSTDFTANQYVYDGIFIGNFRDTRFNGTEISGLSTLADGIGYKAELYYEGNNKVSLALVRGDFTFGGGTKNQNAVARGLESIIHDDNLRSDYRYIIQGLRNLSRHEMHAAESEMAGDIHANTPMLGMWDVARPVVDRIQLDPYNLTDLPRYGQTRHNFWFDSTYSEMSMLGDGNARGYRIQRPGLMLGLDRKWTTASVAGLFFGYSNPKLTSGSDSTDAHDFQVGVYGGMTTLQRLEIKAYGGVGFQTYSTRRVIDNAVLVSAPTYFSSEYEGHSFNTTLEFGTPFTWDWGVVRPIAAVDWSISGVNGHNEVSSDPQSLLAGSYEHSYYGRFNVRAGGRIELAQTDLTSLWFQMFVGVTLFGDESPQTKMRFVNVGNQMSSITVNGSDPGAGYITLGFGNYWNLNVQKTRQLAIHYDLFASQRMTNNAVWLALVQKW
ncbi:MAG: autotransporter-associated beta strand repeat-containing protein [Planctomycetaceae bacterium]|jgi:autotransporter-associated beta strand protein/predicted outer membrane repeat protein|nr:autotransporter-associated beta strand repeat-containing protein [Planctomycetaceae bacterium]